MRYTRRSFLQTAAAAGIPLILPTSVWSAATKPNDKLGVGFIGMGKQSRGLLGGFINRSDVRVLAVCDVDTTRREDARKRVDAHYASTTRSECAACVDFREIIARDDIDAVCIATPDHWHTVQVLAALKAGKDVYCEKPLTHNVHESKLILAALAPGRRVMQTGSMQRSSSEFRVACELVRNGAIGRIERVECSFGNPPVPCDLPGESVEPGLDWDMWLGPAPERPYHSELSPRGMHDHYPNWRNYIEYGGGMVTDWGAHHLDIAQWGLGMDDSGPVKVLPPAGKGNRRGATLVYANGVTVEHKDGFGVDFFGTEGRMRVNRGRFVFERQGKTIASFKGEKDQDTNCAMEVGKAEKEFLKDAATRLYVSRNHIGDFLDCVKSRKKPITTGEIGARSAICCHLMNVAYLNHASFEWDPAKNAFAGGTGNPKWLTKEYRKPWRV